jgi:hypothetical protein
MMGRPQVVTDSMIIGVIGGMRKGPPMKEEIILDMMIGQMSVKIAEETRRVRPNSMTNAIGGMSAKPISRRMMVLDKYYEAIAIRMRRLRPRRSAGGM